MPVTFTLPPDTRVTGGGSPAADMNNVVDALRAMGLVTHNVLSAGFAGGADPTGASDSTAAIQAALTACPPGGVVWVPGVTWNGSAWVQAVYRYTTLSVPQGVVLMSGLGGYRATPMAKLRAITSTTGASVTFAAATPAGAIANIELDGSLLPAGTVDGIGCYVNCKQGSITGVKVHNFTRHGIAIVQNGGNPDGWYLREITSHNNATHGVSWDYAVDGQMDTFHLDNNGGSGLAVGTLNNITFTNGKCQQNAYYGYTGTGGFVKTNASFTGCLALNNGRDGWHLDFNAGGGNGSLSLNGCGARDDGTSGASGSGYAGLYLNPKSADVTINGFTTYVTASSAGPDYGLNLTGTLASVSVFGGSFGGSLAGYHDGGGNTGAVFKSNVAEWAGQSDTKSASAVASRPGAILACKSYAPGTRGALTVSSTTMTAVSSGNCQTGSFTAPASGQVLVRSAFVAQISGAASMAYGLAAAGTVTPIVGNITQFNDSSSTATLRAVSVETVVTGLTPGTSYNFDLLAAAQSTYTITVAAQAITSTTPGLTTATNAGPVTMTVYAL